MKSRITALAPAIRRALAVTSMGIITLPAVAEEAPHTTSLDRLEVTGSRIRQVDLETSQPVLSINRADIEKQGASSVADILQNITAMGSPSFGRSDALASDPEAGGSYVDMRGLGPQRTLVLVNGKRLGMSTAGYQDVSTIPASAVERIEVLKDGASAIYGSDAMAGVVNIITRSRVEGVTANVYHGQYSQGDGAHTRFDVVGGWSNDTLSLTLSAEHAEEQAVWAKNRWFSSSGSTDRRPAEDWTTLSQWGQITGLAGGPGCTKASGCNYSLDRGTDSTNPSNYHLTDSTGITGDVSNSNQQMGLVTPMKRDAVFLDGRWDISDTLRLDTQIGYNTRNSVNTIAGYPVQSSMRGLGQMSGDSYFNPFGNQHGYDAPTAVSWNRRGWEVPRVTTSDLTAWRGVAALSGAFDIGERYFDWEAGYQYNRTTLRSVQTGNLIKDRIMQSLGPSYRDTATGQVRCGTPGAPVADCIAWNPLAAYGSDDPNGLTANQALRDWLYAVQTAQGKTTSRNAFANIAGSIATLPAGDLGFAFGIERRKETGSFVPDALAQADATTSLANGPTGGEYRVEEAYLELQVPLLADLPGARALALNAATRFSGYDTFGDTLNSKFGVTWKPIDALLVRGSWAQGFRAPTIDDLYGGAGQSFETRHSDPCDTVYGAAASDAAVLARCARDIADATHYRQLKQGMVPTTGPVGQTPIPFRSVSNPLMQPETSISRTLGVVWSPGFLQDFNVSLDWWKIRIDNTIVADSSNQILIDCYEKGIDARCTSFTRDPDTGIINALDYGKRNAGFRETEGYDLEATYKRATTVGTFNATLSTTYLVDSRYRSSDDADEVPTPEVGIVDNSGATFRVRSTLTMGWEKGNLGVSWTSRYYSATKEECTFDDACTDLDVSAPWYAGTKDFNRLPSVTFHDVQVRYALPWDATVSIGANNVFGTYGPAMYSAPASAYSYYGGYDIGRFMYMKYQQRF